ncbi:MAG TPA: CesT family type III secretion system chaperone [Polyangiaceae bacterium]|nr:CesT family type III secretion system chaperone [Polyangiaceae bacterium]
MRTAKDVEAYLAKLNRSFSEVDDTPGTYLLRPSSGDGTAIAMRVDPPLVVLRVHIGDVRKDKDRDGNAGLFRRLLQLNARGLVHASYGLDEDRIVLSAALELENLDFNELEATLDEIDLAVAQQVPELAELSKKA